MPRVHAEVAAEGVHIGRTRVARLMRAPRREGRESPEESDRDAPGSGRGRAHLSTRTLSLAFWQPSLTCSLDNPLEFLAKGWIVGSP